MTYRSGVGNEMQHGGVNPKSETASEPVGEILVAGDPVRVRGGRFGLESGVRELDLQGNLQKSCCNPASDLQKRKIRPV